MKERSVRTPQDAPKKRTGNVQNMSEKNIDDDPVRRVLRGVLGRPGAEI